MYTQSVADLQTPPAPQKLIHACCYDIGLEEPTHLLSFLTHAQFNSQDANTFASASLDRTVKVWGLSNLQPHFTLEGHDKGVNCVEYFAGGDRPYLVTGAGGHGS